MSDALHAATAANVPADEVTLLDLLVPLARRWRSLVVAPILIGVATYGATYLVAPTFTSASTFLPPQQQPAGGLAALASLSGLASLGSATGVLKSPADEYVTMLQGPTISDRIIAAFDLRKLYDVKYIDEAREQLAKRVSIDVGKKDGLITVSVDDHDPKRAAAMANRYVEELRRLTGAMTLTEAQQRRAFFEEQLLQTKKQLTAAQIALQGTGVTAATLKAEARSAVEGIARVDAELTVARVKLQTLRNSLTDNAFEVKQQQALVGALEAQKRRLAENGGDVAQDPAAPGGSSSADYITRYRDFKYQEALFELYARQYELARADESREAAPIQVVDVAIPAERKSKPKRVMIAALATLLSGLGYATLLVARSRWQSALVDPLTAERVHRLRAAFSRRSA